MENKKILRFLIIGEPLSGKTSLFDRCINDNFDSKSYETGSKILDDYILKLTDYDFDPNGTLSPSSFKNINGYIIVVNSDKNSFEYIESALSFIKSISNFMNIIIFYNKSDLFLPDIKSIDNYMDKIRITYGNNIKYLVGSAKLNTNIDKIFDIIKELISINNFIDCSQKFKKTQSLQEISIKKVSHKQIPVKSKSCVIQ